MLRPYKGLKTLFKCVWRGGGLRGGGCSVLNPTANATVEITAVRV